jgi:hypothetical protein
LLGARGDLPPAQEVDGLIDTDPPLRAFAAPPGSLLK